MRWPIRLTFSKFLRVVLQPTDCLLVPGKLPSIRPYRGPFPGRQAIYRVHNPCLSTVPDTEELREAMLTRESYA